MMLCQPDSGKGCSACCGIFNMRDISRENIGRVLSGKRPFPEEMNKQDLRDVTSHICMYQSLLKENVPGCILHPLYTGTDRRDESLFGKKICERFLCPAHSILNENEKHLLKVHVNDWYCYMIAITDPESFQWILNSVLEHIDAGSRLFSELLEEALELHAEALMQYTGAVFCYSIPEYVLEKESFSLQHDSYQARKTRYKILRILQEERYSINV